jgi:hypothetical protein
MSGTTGSVRTDTTLLTEFSDGQAAGSITPQRVRDLIASKRSIAPPINAQSSSYTLTLSDTGNIISLNSTSGITVTIPTNASSTIPVGAEITLCQTGIGMITVEGVSGVTVNAQLGYRTSSAGQYARVLLHQLSTDVWVVSGSLKSAPSYYVDNSLTTNGNGLSWGTAWNSLAAVIWSQITPGSVLYISGGTSGQTYSEVLSPAASGTSGSPIVISGGVDSGHNGPVIIDRGIAAYPCINVDSGYTNLVIQNLVAQNTNDNCVTVRSVTAGTVIVQNLTVHTGMGTGGGNNARGVDVRFITGSGTVIVQNNYIDTPDNTTSQTDGVWTSNNNTTGGVFIQNNTIVIKNTDSTGHSDGIQNVQEATATYRNNIIWHPNGGLNNHGIFMSDIVAGGVVNIYNNIIIMGQSLSGVTDVGLFLLTQTSGYTGTCNVYNNTFYSGYSAIYISEPTFHATFNIKNNIIYALPMTFCPYVLYNGDLGTPANVDYNLVFYTGANNRASYVSGTGTGAVRSTTSQSSGLWYFEFQWGLSLSSGSTMIGIANSSQPLNTWVGSTANSIGYEWQDGSTYIGGAHSTTIQASVSGDISAVAVDLTNKKIWIKNLTQNSGWNNAALATQNPATGTGGVSFSSITGPYFIAVSVAALNDYVVLNAGGSGFYGTIPSGFSAWGNSTTWSPTDIGSPCTLTPAIAISSLSAGSGTARSWTAWKTAGYDVHGVNSDPNFSSTAALRIGAGSPAINAGTTLSVVAQDFWGAKRPQGTSYCIGAYEYPI